MTTNDRQLLEWIRRTDRHYRDAEANRRWIDRQAREAAAKETDR